MRQISVILLLLATGCGRSPEAAVASADNTTATALVAAYREVNGSKGFQATIARLKSTTLAPTLRKFLTGGPRAGEGQLQRSLSLSFAVREVDRSYHSAGALLAANQQSGEQLSTEDVSDFLRGGDQSDAVGAKLKGPEYTHFIAKQMHTLLLLAAYSEHSAPGNALSLDDPTPSGANVSTGTRVAKAAGSVINHAFNGLQLSEIIGDGIRLHAARLAAWNLELDSRTADKSIKLAAKRQLYENVLEAQQTAPTASKCTKNFIKAAGGEGKAFGVNSGHVTWECKDNVPGEDPHWEASWFISV